MKNLSPLQEERLKYQPKLPSSLAGGISSLNCVEGSATQSVANQAEIKELFQNTYGKPAFMYEFCKKDFNCLCRRPNNQRGQGYKCKFGYRSLPEAEN